MAPGTADEIGITVGASRTHTTGTNGPPSERETRSYFGGAFAVLPLQVDLAVVALRRHAYRHRQRRRGGVRRGIVVDSDVVGNWRPSSAPLVKNDALQALGSELVNGRGAELRERNADRHPLAGGKVTCSCASGSSTVKLPGIVATCSPPRASDSITLGRSAAAMGTVPGE